MKRRNPPQPGNPRGITCNQHVFPRAAIERFCDVKNQVAVFGCGSLKPKLRHYNHPVFLADRAWADHAEHGYMHMMEEAYNAVAKSYAAATSPVMQNLGDDESKAVSDFWFLWQMRAHFRSASQKPVTLQGIKPDTGLRDPDTGGPVTQDTEEKLEKMGVVTAHLTGDNGNAAVLARQFYAGQILMGCNQLRAAWGLVNWVCCRIANANLIVPDQSTSLPCNKTALPLLYVPLTPASCFLAVANRAISNTMPLTFSVSADLGKLKELCEANPKGIEACLNEQVKRVAKAYYFQHPDGQG